MDDGKVSYCPILFQSVRRGSKYSGVISSSRYPYSPVSVLLFQLGLAEVYTCFCSYPLASEEAERHESQDWLEMIPNLSQELPNLSRDDTIHGPKPSGSNRKYTVDNEGI